MSERTNNFIRLGNVRLDDNAFNYEIRKEDVDKKAQSIFEHYDTSGDGILDCDELSVLKKDMDEANTDDKADRLTKKESKTFLEKVFPDGNVKASNIEKFANSLQKNYEYKIENILDDIFDNSRQGNTGDCWLLQQARSLSLTDWGTKAIKDSITEDELNDCYTVTLSGVNYTATITKSELKKGRKKLSSGELNMILLELAVKKYFEQEVKTGNMDLGKDVLRGGWLTGKLSLQYLLTGKQGHTFVLRADEHKKHKKPKDQDVYEWEQAKDTHSYLGKREQMEKILSKLAQNTGKYALGCTFVSHKKWDNKESYDKAEKNKRYNNTNNHAFTVKEIKLDENGNLKEVILINPWDSAREIHKTADEFLDQVGFLSVVSEDDNYEEFMDQVSTVSYTTKDGKDID